MLVSAGPVFVAGATGHTGAAVVREASARGLDVVAHVRPDSRRLEHWRGRFEELGARVDQSAWTPEAITATLTQLQPSIVFALLGTTKKRARDGGSGSAVADSYEAVDYGLSILLLDAAVACGSRPRFVYLSALGADGRPANAYMKVRTRVEAAVRASGLPYLLARPGFISGDREQPRLGERLAARAGDGLLAFAGALGAKKLQARYASLTGAELGAALVELASTASEDALVAEADRLRAAAQ